MGASIKEVAWSSVYPLSQSIADEVRRIRFEYYASDGGYGWGFVDPTSDGLNFPGDHWVGGDGQRMRLRTVQTHQADSYTNSSFGLWPGQRRWRRLYTTRFTRTGPASAPR